MPVSIIIPAFNELECCQQCVQSILDNTSYPYRLILVDNGSTDGVGAYFDSVPDATVVHTGENKGFAGGVNAGLAHAEGHVLLLNSDTVVPPNWLGRMVEPFGRDPKIGMVGPMSNCVSGIQEIAGLEFGAMESMIQFSEALFLKHKHSTQDVTRLVGFCMLIRDTVFQEVGLLDEAFGVGNFEDDDYCMRVLGAGYGLCIAEGAFVFHYGSRTFMSMGYVDDVWQENIERNEHYFSRKWDCLPEERSEAIQESHRFNGLALEALDGQRAEEAIKLVYEAIRCAPTYEESYNTLGLVLWEMDEREKSVKYFKQTLHINSGHKMARKNLVESGEILGISAEIQTFLDTLDS